MTNEEFYKHILTDFYEPKKIDLADFSQLIASIGPAFGEVGTIVEPTENGKKITIRDNDVYTSAVNAKGETIEGDFDMSTNLLTVHLDKKDIITIVEHGGLIIFTPANKSKVLFYASLIGKKILFD